MFDQKPGREYFSCKMQAIAGMVSKGFSLGYEFLIKDWILDFYNAGLSNKFFSAGKKLKKSLYANLVRQSMINVFWIVDDITMKGETIYICSPARVAKLVDAPSSGGGVRKDVLVRIQSRAQSQ